MSINSVQFELIRLLSGKYHNLCVVGDDDQSIYKFRGADITNILSFEETFPGAKVVKLEQNYRSTNNILEAANAVIANNAHRKEKHLWSENGEGKEVSFIHYETAYGEAEDVIDKIQTSVHMGKHQYQDCAILYRTNAQSRVFEEKCIKKSVPYRLVGGVLCAILALIGILNFINSMMTSILSRYKEIAMLQSVGMTGHQVKRMLVYEGIAYSVLGLLLSLILSIIGSLTVVRMMGSELSYFTWHFTLLPVILSILPLFIITAFVPFLCYKKMAQKTVVERLRIIE